MQFITICKLHSTTEQMPALVGIYFTQIHAITLNIKFQRTKTIPKYLGAMKNFTTLCYKSCLYLIFMCLSVLIKMNMWHRSNGGWYGLFLHLVGILKWNKNNQYRDYCYIIYLPTQWHNFVLPIWKSSVIARTEVINQTWLDWSDSGKMSSTLKLFIYQSRKIT
jgi:hypothetical protein